MLTDEEDLVMDPFAGSCVTGEVSERLKRKWVCVELVEKYLEGAIGRFERDTSSTNGNGTNAAQTSAAKKESNYYRIPRPGILWNGSTGEPLQVDGGKSHHISVGARKSWNHPENCADGVTKTIDQ